MWPLGFIYVGCIYEDRLNGFGRMIHRLSDTY